MPSRAHGEAAGHGRWEILQWLEANGVELIGQGNEVEKAVKNNHAEVAMWLTENVPISLAEGSQMNLPALAAANRNVELVQWSCGFLLDDAETLSSSAIRAVQAAIDEAAKAGDADILEWILSSDKVKNGVRVDLGKLAIGGHYELMKNLFSRYKANVAIGSTAREAVLAGRLDMLQWLYSSFGLCTFTGMLNKAVARGHLEVAKWLRSKSTGVCSPQALDNAAACGFLDVLQWTHENTKGECSSAAISGAAAGGHLDVVKWLSCSFPDKCRPDTMDQAALHNHLDVVQWLHVNRMEGCTVAQ
ncbi:unnamed protein product [Phytophthora lilii]|uniref:Unnamed protein product n=1 Tax=Phytophthora lilii TaxID=2077276 RepID=A0A9W6WSU1_9STRA|nr:unnamed protein product [Phytophthora lilii]